MTQPTPAPSSTRTPSARAPRRGKPQAAAATSLACPFCQQQQAPADAGGCPHLLAWVVDGEVRPLPAGEPVVAPVRALLAAFEGCASRSQVREAVRASARLADPTFQPWLKQLQPMLQRPWRRRGGRRHVNDAWRAVAADLLAPEVLRGLIVAAFMRLNEGRMKLFERMWGERLDDALACLPGVRLVGDGLRALFAEQPDTLQPYVEAHVVRALQVLDAGASMRPIWPFEGLGGLNRLNPRLPWRCWDRVAGGTWWTFFGGGSGTAEYHLAKAAEGTWLLQQRTWEDEYGERGAERYVIAAAFDVDPSLRDNEIAAVLYELTVRRRGSTISEPDWRAEDCDLVNAGLFFDDDGEKE
jgi:hypothetical protein